ncbi:GPO family capsid scaffolding protein [Actinobacillus equuli subsp. haemolyticus]|uniref:GPO family capsid scaffolding protein n=1 Tax=Actinobacillus equuli subsp. equuli TaxID=202947 RepID=A0A9X4G3C5_ACTEU|nr:GPO family capsid scaffolding protein [Actinobacillus equuli]MDE8034656.1 GPO family capsid scaffolding protein [Actinobacillus equuli subsp. equuli]MDG4948705.1 GPO family capsid scaffolding protein [Actinobacillus equuli subsp. haemolyticus]WGE63801.1 GPO family capsid scaffolding protein [Actinobacillus equuli subsp. haemolyticus]
MGNKTKSKWFVVATEGATTDGREIQRKWIEEMSEGYDPVNTYGARINLDHIKFAMYWGDDFPHSMCFGDVLAVKAEEREDGKLQLLAEIHPTEGLLELNKKRQKVYTSVEIDTNFAGTGKAYLVGLAVTDNPASLGTEMLQFSSNGLSERKLKPENVFSSAIETVFEFEDVKEKTNSGLLDKIKAMFAGKEKATNESFSEHQKAIELIGEETAGAIEKCVKLEEQSQKLSEKIEALTNQVETMKKQFDALTQSPHANYTPRPQVAGSDSKTNNGFIF